MEGMRNSIPAWQMRGNGVQHRMWLERLALSPQQTQCFLSSVRSQTKLSLSGGGYSSYTVGPLPGRPATGMRSRKSPPSGGWVGVCEMGLGVIPAPLPGQPDLILLGPLEGLLSLLGPWTPVYLSQIQPPFPLPPSAEEAREAGCGSQSWASAQACQEKPPCLLAYAASTPGAGARRAGQGGRPRGFVPGACPAGVGEHGALRGRAIPSLLTGLWAGHSHIGRAEGWLGGIR